MHGEPHACGEYSRSVAQRQRACGSSPRVWGIRPTLLRRDYAGRFIPTRVGNTITGFEPRELDRGSSPRVWGIPMPLCDLPMPVGFIPTRVGNTVRHSLRTADLSVHPHACGEYSTFFLRPCPLVGSSPRVWGIQALCTPAGCRTRFIPTRVGNTHNSGKTWAGCAVHPHACGEYLTRRGISGTKDGSSPRVWGILARPSCGNLPARFIPTRVGNTLPSLSSRALWPVHPHACGEYFGIFFLQFFQCGSSPRVWGIRRGARRDARPARFIPTRVGNTL